MSNSLLPVRPERRLKAAPLLWLQIAAVLAAAQTPNPPAGQIPATGREAEKEQDTRRVPGGFTLTSLSLVAGREENIPLGSRRISDTVFLLSPGTMKLSASHARGDFSLAWRPQFEMFRVHTDLNAWGHAAAMRFTAKLSPRWTMEAADRFQSTPDGSRDFAERLFLLPRGRLWENSASLGFGYQAGSRTTLHFGADNTWSDFAGSEGLPSSAFRQIGLAGTGGITHQATPRGKVGVAYAYLRLRSETATTAGVRDLTVFHQVAGTYSHALTPATSLDFGGGAILHGTTASPSFSAQLQHHRNNGRLLILAGYQRTLAFFGAAPGTPADLPGLGGPRGVGRLDRLGNPILSGTFSESVAFRVRGPLAARFGMDAMASAVRTGLSQGTPDFHTWFGRLRWDYCPAPRWRLLTGVEWYRQNVNQFLGAPINRRRYFTGLEFDVVSLDPAWVCSRPEGI
jgi:hypothetical protein